MITTTTTTTVTTTTETKTKTNTGITEIVCILDRSGSMDHLTQDTIGGYNAFIAKQKEDAAEAYVTTVIFDDHYEVLYESMPLEDVPVLTQKEYYARGGTALLDAIGKSIASLKSRIIDPDVKVILLIITDGAENSSREYTNSQIKMLINQYEENKNHVIMYFGANVDAFDEAGNFGVNRAFAANYEASMDGTTTLYSAMSMSVTGVRGECGPQGPQGAIGEKGADWRSELKGVAGNEDL